MRQQDEADHYASHEVSHHYLQEGEVGVVGKAGNADDGERAGLGGDDGKGDGPPGDVSSGEKVVTERAMTLAEAQAEQGDPNQVQRDDCQVEFVEAHIFELPQKSF